MQVVRWLPIGTLLLMGLALSACTSRYQAPVDQAGEPLFLNSGRQHFVNAGETLYAVAWMYDLDFAALARANNLQEPYNLREGQMLTVDLRGQALNSSNGSGNGYGNSNSASTVSEAASSAVTVAKATSISTSPLKRAPLPAANEEIARSASTTLPNSSPLPTVSASQAPDQSAADAALAKTPAPPATNNDLPSASSPNSVITAPPALERPNNTSSAAPGSLSWGWPHKGTLLARFADSTGDNKGVDIAGNAGDAVLAAADGEVVYAGSGLLRYGNLIIVKHNERFLSAYAHNRALLVNEKEKVKKGQKIAELGSSGIDRNMLHFEIRLDGKPVDPLQYLPTQ